MKTFTTINSTAMIEGAIIAGIQFASASDSNGDLLDKLPTIGVNGSIISSE